MRSFVRGRFAPVSGSVALAALTLALALGAAPAPAAAQTAGVIGSFSPGPGASGNNPEFQGFVQTPVAGSTVPAGTPLTIAGWAVDPTSTNGAGFAQMEVLNGPMDQGGQVLATGDVDLATPTVVASTGLDNGAQAGYTVVVPGSDLTTPGSTTLYVYLQRASNGAWWDMTVPLTVGPASS